jgi:hypothetical protein
MGGYGFKDSSLSAASFRKRCAGHTLTAIVNGHKQSRIAELMPWNYAATV